MNLQNPEGIWDTEFPTWVQEHYVNVKGDKIKVLTNVTSTHIDIFIE